MDSYFARMLGYLGQHLLISLMYIICIYKQKFIVSDLDGEEPKQAIITGITQEVEGLANTTEDKRHGFQDGDYVTFREVMGMKEVNEQVFQIKVKSPYMFSIGDTTKFTPYEREGIAIQVKVPKEF